MIKILFALALISLSACVNQLPLTQQERADNDERRLIERNEKTVEYIRNQQTFQKL